MNSIFAGTKAKTAGVSQKGMYLLLDFFSILNDAPPELDEKLFGSMMTTSPTISKPEWIRNQLNLLDKKGQGDLCSRGALHGLFLLTDITVQKLCENALQAP